MCLVLCATLDFPGGTMDGSLPASAEDTGANPDPRRLHMPQSN